MAFRATDPVSWPQPSNGPMQGLPQNLTVGAIHLRPLDEADLPEVVRQLSDPRIAPWLAAVPQPFDLPEARALLDHSRHPGETMRIIETEGALAGCLCLGAGLWYWLDAAFHGRGLMRTALSTALSEWFARPSPPLIATSREDNTASRGLLTRLGFAQPPRTRRMFFHGSGRSEPCFDYVMAPEQWHLLNPPKIKVADLVLRPARQKDAALLAQMTSANDPVWPMAEHLPAFLETHRVRTSARGIFVIEDDATRLIGMALLKENQPPQLKFLSDAEAERHTAKLLSRLSIVVP
ncbi:GNAT family N-acetyltransferase [Antarctobacter jejuensis]|uniref:GNAT family N-acetyltransferase n=1 Tax=Antarctobacter jejuensis TaxID=1439938 RepID=UPI003FD5807E